MHFLEAFHEIDKSFPGIRIALAWLRTLENHVLNFDSVSVQFQAITSAHI